MPAKQTFKGQPDTTHVINDAEGELKFKTDSKGEYTPKNDREEAAILRAYPEPPPAPAIPEEFLKLAEEEEKGGES